MGWNESRESPWIPSQLCQASILIAPSRELVTWLNTIVPACLKRVRRWKTPPNWGSTEWLKEMEAQGRAAGLEALRQYDASRALSPAGFMMSRIMARCLTCYRQEWAFASRCVKLPESGELHESWMSAFSMGPGTGAWEYEELLGALAQLDEFDRWMLQRMFWEARPQREIARELGLSQPAVCKRKHLILNKQRRYLCLPKKKRETGYQTGLGQQ